MKKIFKISVFAISLFALCEGLFAKDPKVATGAPVTLDWQGRESGIDIPDWVKAVGENNKRKISKELDLGDYQIWVFNARGSNIQFLETWTDKVELQSNVAQSISSEIGRATQAAMTADQSFGETQINQTITDVTTVLSNVRVNGLERMGSFWTKSGIANKKKPKTDADYDITYTYYAVWAMPKDAFQAQLDVAMINLPQNTAQDPILMKMITKAIEKTIFGEDSGTISSYDNVK